MSIAIFYLHENPNADNKRSQYYAAANDTDQ